MVLKLVFLDIDGTAVPTSSGRFLAERIGHFDDVDEAEARYDAGLISNDRVCDIDARGWAGLSVEQISHWLEELPLTPDLLALRRWSLANGVLVAFASLAWTPVSEALSKRLGFEVSGGPQLSVSNGRFTGRVRRYFNEYDKRDAASALASRHGISPSDCVAIGDSRSDLPLFAAVGSSIAFNADSRTRQAAIHSVDSKSFAPIVRLLEKIRLEASEDR